MVSLLSSQRGGCCCGGKNCLTVVQVLLVSKPPRKGGFFVEKKGKIMNIEGTNDNIDPNEVPVSQEAELRSRLSRSIRVMADLRYKAEQNGLAAGSDVAEKVILQNIPTVEYVVDGSLRSTVGQTTVIEDRVDLLPIELVTETQGRIDSLLSIMNVVPSIGPAMRLDAYLPVTLPF